MDTSRETKVVTHARWLRHAATLPAVAAGACYGVEQGSRGALVLAGVAALAWFAWPEVSRFLAWRTRRRIEGVKLRSERAMTRADREVATGERAEERADPAALKRETGPASGTHGEARPAGGHEGSTNEGPCT